MLAGLVAVLLLAQDASVERAVDHLHAGRREAAVAEIQSVLRSKEEPAVSADQLRTLCSLGDEIRELVHRGVTGENFASALKAASAAERTALLRLAPSLSDPVPAIPAILAAGDEAARALHSLSLKGKRLTPEALEGLHAAASKSGLLAEAAKAALAATEERVAPASGPSPTEPRQVRVFYGTDRAAKVPTAADYAFPFWPALLLLIVAGVAVRPLFWALHPRFAPAERWIRWTLTGFGILLAVFAGYNGIRQKLRIDRLGFDYGPDRGPFHEPERYAHFGACRVGIPPVHRAGQIERPSLLSAHPWEDPQRHVMVLRIEPLEKPRFFSELGEAGRERAFVFVHGFNVSFEDAALRTAQIAHDLEFDGAPIFFSWPSRASVFEYTVDEATVTWATHHLKLFLRDVRRTLPRATIHLIAHSMGNRALTEALRSLSVELGKDLPRFQEVILAAPDIDAATFREDIVPALRPTGERITLYCAPYDEALAASRRFHGFPRAGDSSQGVFVAEGLETIDVAVYDPDILGHSYFGSVEPVLEDIVSLILHRKRPGERGLTPMGRFWRLGK